MRFPQISALVLRSAALLIALFLSHSVSGVTFTITPNSVTDQYSGLITLQIDGLNPGETVTIQKYADADGNGVVDAADFLEQSFQLTDNQGPPVIAGVTNINVPGDLNATTGTISAQLNPVIESFAGRIVGQYILVLSSPVSRFSPVTALFTVTPSFSRQTISGNVTCSGTNVPNAVILLVQQKSNLDGFNPYGGTLANSAGSYTLKLAPGNYTFMAAKYGFVTDTTKAVSVTLASGAALTANLSLIPATATISGKFVDSANASQGLPGLLLGAQSSAGLLSLGTTSSNGGFALPVTSGQWFIGAEEQGFNLLDYVGLHKEIGFDTSTGSVAGVTFALPKGTAFIYGSVRDTQNNPVSGLRLSADNRQNGNAAYKGNGTTDQNGNYVMAVTAGLWSPNLDAGASGTLIGNYVFSDGPAWTFNNGGSGTNLNPGMVAQANFSALPATNLITGSLKDGGGNPITNVQVYAYATINGNNFNQGANTDIHGNYSLNVGNGNWTVGVSCCANCGNNNLSSNYQCPNSQTVNVSNGNGSANFVALALGAYQITGSLKNSSGSPIANVQIYASASVNGNNYNVSAITDVNGNYSLDVANGTWTIGVSCCNGTNCSNGLPAGYECLNQQTVNISNGNAVANFIANTGGAFQINGAVTDGNGNGITNISVTASAPGNLSSIATTDANGYYSLSVGAGSWVVSVDCNGLSARGFSCVGSQAVQILSNGNSAYFTVQPCGPLQVSTTALTDGFIGSNYFFQLATSGCHPPFTWALSPGSLALPQGLSLLANGTVSGSPSVAGTNYFSVRVTDGQGNKADGLVSIEIYQPLQITNSSLPNGTLGVPYTAQLKTTGGSSGFFGANLANGTLPPGLILFLDGSISGTPTQLGTFQFSVTVNDNSGLDAAQATFTITISLPNLLITTTAVTGASAGQPFSFQLQTAGGTAPFVWSVALGSQPLPGGLALASGGLISGTPTAGGVSTVIIRVTDANGLSATASVQITISASLSLGLLSSPAFSLNNGFQFTASAPAGQSYTVQYSIALTNWLSLFVTNPPVTPFTIVDRGATNQRRFYRLLLPAAP